LAEVTLSVSESGFEKRVLNKDINRIRFGVLTIQRVFVCLKV